MFSCLQYGKYICEGFTLGFYMRERRAYISSYSDKYLLLEFQTHHNASFSIKFLKYSQQKFSILLLDNSKWKINNDRRF